MKKRKPSVWCCRVQCGVLLCCCAMFDTQGVVRGTVLHGGGLWIAPGAMSSTQKSNSRIGGKEQKSAVGAPSLLCPTHENEGEPTTESPSPGGFLVTEMRGGGVVSMGKTCFSMSK
jgi:hypothetical protein